MTGIQYACFVRMPRLAVCGLLCCCPVKLEGCGRTTPPAAGTVAVAPTTNPAPINEVWSVPLPQDSTAPCPCFGKEAVTPLDMEYFARHLEGTWAEISPGRFATAFMHPENNKLIYVFPDMAAPENKLPGLHGFSAEGSVDAANLKDSQLICMRPQTRYLRTDDGKMLMIGFFDPAHGAFFRWRGELREPFRMEFHPDSDAMSPEVAPGRVHYIIDIDEPKGGRELEHD